MDEVVIGTNSYNNKVSLVLNGGYSNITQPIFAEGKVFMLLEKIFEDVKVLHYTKGSRNFEGSFIGKASWYEGNLGLKEAHVDRHSELVWNEMPTDSVILKSEIFNSFVLGDDYNGNKDKQGSANGRKGLSPEEILRDRELKSKLIVIDDKEARIINYNFKCY